MSCTRLINPAARCPGVGLAHAEVERALRNGGADRPTWIERTIRILKNHLHLAAKAHGVFSANSADRLAVQLDVALRRLDQAHQQTGQRGLSGSGFAHDAKGLPLEDLQVDAVDSRDAAASAKPAATFEDLSQSPGAKLKEGGNLGDA